MCNDHFNIIPMNHLMPEVIHTVTSEMVELKEAELLRLIENHKTGDIAISLIDSGMFDKPKRRDILWVVKSCKPCKIGFIEGKMLHIDLGFLDHKKHQVIHFLIELNKQSPLYMYPNKSFDIYNNDNKIYYYDKRYALEQDVNFNIDDLELSLPFRIQMDIQHGNMASIDIYRVRQTNVKINEYSYLLYDDRDCEFIETTVQIGDYNIKLDGSTIECINDRIIPFLILNSKHPNIRISV